MSGFIYYVPRLVMPTLDVIRGWALGYAFEKEPANRQTEHGPQNIAGGYLFADSKRFGGQLKLDEEIQHWRRMETRSDDQQEIWLGWLKEAPPTPAELARPKMLPGFELKMADGNTWNVPVVCRLDWETAERRSVLPSHYDLDGRGNLVMGEMQEVHRWLWDLTTPAWDAMVGDREISQQDMLPVAGGIMSANYLVSEMELIALKALSPEISPFGLVALAIDYHTWSAWNDAQKKTNPSLPSDDSTTKPGSEENSQATDQLAAIS